MRGEVGMGFMREMAGKLPFGETAIPD